MADKLLDAGRETADLANRLVLPFLSPLSCRKPERRCPKCGSTVLKREKTELRDYKTFDYKTGQWK